jgi:hypothetical protein
MGRAGRESGGPTPSSEDGYDLFDEGVAEELGTSGGDEKAARAPYAATEIKPLSKEDLKSLLQNEIFDAIGNLGSNVSEQRRRAIAYYYGKPFGNEQVGRSQVVLTDVADTIEWIMPSLLRMFFGGDIVFRYKPRKPGQEESAKQATDYINQVFLEDDGFMTGHDWMKTGLLEKNGIVKSYYEEMDSPEVTRLQGISELELARVVAEDDVEILEMGERAETILIDNPESGQPMEVPTFDVVVRRIEKRKRIRTVAIPPEEFLIARREIRLNDETSFTCHRVKHTVSDLIGMGFDPDLVLTLPSDDMPEFSLERTERLSEDETFPVTTSERADQAAREIWVNDCYARVDYDGDGFTELRNCIVVGDTAMTLLHNEYTNFNPFASVCPVPMPHKFFGVSVADQVMDLQLIRSTLLRQMLDNVYLQNNGRYAVVEGQVEIDDLLNSLPGGIVRMTAPGMVEPLITPPLPNQAFQMLEYLEGVRETRTGVTRYNQGLDASSLNKTASGMNQIMEAANARIETIARIFAETGFKRLARNYLRLMIESPIKEQVVKLSGTWQMVDPSTWDPEWDVEIEVGLGVGQAAQRIGQLMQMLEIQNGFVSAGMGGMIVKPDNAYNAAREVQLAMGFKNDGYFFTDPEGAEPPPPPPDPAMEKVKQSAEAAEATNATKLKELEVDALRIAQDGEMRKFESEMRAEVDREKIASDERMERARLETDIELARLKVQADLDKAQLASDTQKEVAEQKAQAPAGSNGAAKEN